MRPADYVILGMVMFLGGGVLVKLEMVLGSIKSNTLVHSVKEAVASFAICISGVAVIVFGFFKLLQ